MAEKKKEGQADTKGAAQADGKDTSQPADAAPPKKKGAPPQYTAEELIAASEKALGVPQECAAAAFKIAGKTHMSLDEAKAVVGRFMKQEVR